MPELPEVEIYTRYFAANALDQRIAQVSVLDARMLGEVREETFVKRLRGHAFASARRHGKHLFADCGDLWLHLHFGMSGDLLYYRDAKDQPRFSRVIFDFENGAHLAYDDMRLFGVVELVRDPDEYIAEHQLGPDPLAASFRFRDFERLLEGRKGAIKSLLMTQEIVAGVGNLYADELLFETGIHPRRTVDAVTAKERRALYTTLRRMLREVIMRKSRGAGYPPKFLINHREEGERCPRCGGTIQRATVFGRTTYFCGTHQR